MRNLHMAKNSKQKQQGGLLLHSLVTLALIVLSFTLGYIIGKQRGASQVDQGQSASLEDILKRELNKNAETPPPIAKREAETIDKMAQEQRAATTAPSAASAPAQAPHAQVPIAQTSSATATGSGYTLQFGSFKSADAAKQLQKELKQKSVESSVRKVDLAGKGTWWRVQVGQYASENEAKSAASGFKKKTGKSSLVSKLDAK